MKPPPVVCIHHIIGALCKLVDPSFGIRSTAEQFNRIMYSTKKKKSQHVLGHAIKWTWGSSRSTKFSAYRENLTHKLAI